MGVAHLWKCKQHNGSLTLFRYTFPAILKFCSIETAFRERQNSSFILICWFIISEVDRAIYKYAFLLNKRQDFRITPYFIMHTVRNSLLKENNSANNRLP